MNRRNFVKGLLAIGAGFSILPPSTTYGRIWTVEKRVLLPHEGVGSIWQSHYMAWTHSVPELPEEPMGTVHKKGPELFYRYHNGWVKLKPMTRMLPWRTSVHTPTKNLGGLKDSVHFHECWEPQLVEDRLIPEMDENVPIPNLTAHWAGEKFIVVENGVEREV